MHVAGAHEAIHAANLAGRTFLFVGGPFGPFFRELAASLRQRGARALKAHVNGADVRDWGFRNCLMFLGVSANWPNWIRGAIDRREVTDLVVYGDIQYYARTALAVAREAGLRTHVFEQGYFRPNWITLEQGGVNAHSSLPREPGFYRRNGEPVRDAAHVAVGPITPGAVRSAFWSHMAQYALKPLFLGYQYPYHYASWAQGFGHIHRYFDARKNRRKVADELTALIEQPEPIYLALLQRPGDSQILTHSPFPTIATFIEHVMKSFVVNAPPHSRLVFKSHPLDHGLERYDVRLKQLAEELGIADRVHLLAGGHLATLVRASAGVITLNSTAGLTAIHFGRPTIALGKAIYNMHGLTNQNGLDVFWSSPEAPDLDLYLRFRNVVMRETQLNGGYTTARARRLAIAATLDRLRSGATAKEQQPQLQLVPTGPKLAAA